MQGEKYYKVQHISTKPAQDIEKLLQDRSNCLLCLRSDSNKKRLAKHFNDYHLNHNVVSCHGTSYLCKLNCSGEGRGHYHCPICSFTAQQSARLLKHAKSHGESQFSASEKIPAKASGNCVLVDQSNGIYMVAKNKIGDHIPVHVQHKESDWNTVTKECSSRHCREASNVAAANGTLNFQCMHLDQIKPTQSKATVWSREGFLTNQLSDNERKLLCANIKSIQGNSCDDPVVLWPFSTRYRYFSVMAFERKYFTFHGRLFVKRETSTGEYFCDCRKSSKASGCIHVVLCKVFLEHHKETEMKESECRKSSRNVVQDKKLTSDEVLYQIEQKSYPEKLPNELILKDEASFSSLTELVPTEVTCHMCAGSLRTIKYSDNGTLLDTKFIKRGIKLYFKQCEICKHRYFYKETNQGLHLASKSTLILSLDVCLLIREGISNSVAPGRTARQLSDFLKTCGQDHSIKVNQIRESYLHFELLTEHAYEFHCNVCGFYPIVLHADVCRKGFTQIPLDETLRDSEPRKMHAFWSHVGIKILQGDYDLKDVLNIWCPWISPTNVKEDIISTESQKGSDNNNNIVIEEDTMFSEEGFVDEMKKKTKCELLKYLKCDLKVKNVDEKASKAQIISSIAKTLFTDVAFKKKLFSVFGGTGGFLLFTCSHGVVYALKALLKPESPRDYVDVLLSFKHPPAILVCDMPDRISRHLAKRDPKMLRPNLGMLVEPSSQNIEKANRNDLTVYLPFLDRSDANNGVRSDHDYGHVHPVAGTSCMYVLYDEFHKHNSKKPSEVLRHTSLIKEGIGCPNTQVSEQTNSVLGRCNYFNDKLKPLNHCFFLRLEAHLHNCNVNKSNISERTKCNSTYKLDTDQFGRLFHSGQDVNVKDPCLLYSKDSESDLEEDISDANICDVLFPNFPSALVVSHNPPTTPRKFTFRRLQPVLPTSSTPLHDNYQGNVELPDSNSVQEEASISAIPIHNASSESTVTAELSNVDSSEVITVEDTTPSIHGHARISESSVFGSKDSLDVQRIPVLTKDHPVPPSQMASQKQASTFMSATLPIETKSFLCLADESNESTSMKLVYALQQKTTKNYFLCEVNGVNVHADDICSILGDNSLNDSAINAFLQVLVKKYPETQAISASAFKVFMDEGSAQTRILDVNFAKNITFIPYCVADHWILIVLFPSKKIYAVMDPLGELDSVCKRIESTLIKYVSSLTSCSWSRKTIQHDRQTDSTSCGAYILKFALSVLGNSELEALPTEECRRVLAASVIQHGDVSLEFCAYCRCKSKKNSKKWIQCDQCDRWIHDVCIRNPKLLLDISLKAFTCEICELSLSQTNFVKFEVLFLEKTKASKCAGCHGPLRSNTKRPKTLILRFLYDKSFYCAKLKREVETTNVRAHLHLSKKCVTLAFPGTRDLTERNFCIQISCLEELCYNPASFEYFEREFQVKLKNIKVA